MRASGDRLAGVSGGAAEWKCESAGKPDALHKLARIWSMACFIVCATIPCFAQQPMIVPAPVPAKTGSNVHVIDLPTALRLAGAQNLDIQIARERVAEARANDE